MAGLGNARTVGEHLTIVAFLIALTRALSTQTVNGQDNDADLTARAGAILGTYCFRCHKGEGSESGYAFFSNSDSVAAISIEGLDVANEFSEDKAGYPGYFLGRKSEHEIPVRVGWAD